MPTMRAPFCRELTSWEQKQLEDHEFQLVVVGVVGMVNVSEFDHIERLATFNRMINDGWSLKLETTSDVDGTTIWLWMK